MNKDSLVKDYEVGDIALWLMERNENYQTVMWEMLEDVVITAIDECDPLTLEELYQYVLKNLL